MCTATNARSLMSGGWCVTQEMNLFDLSNRLLGASIAVYAAIQLPGTMIVSESSPDEACHAVDSFGSCMVHYTENFDNRYDAYYGCVNSQRSMGAVYNGGQNTHNVLPLLRWSAIFGCPSSEVSRLRARRAARLLTRRLTARFAVDSCYNKQRR